MRKLPWDAEAHAAQIVCAQLGGIARKVDQGGGAQQLHDFDVDLPDGSVLAVEVTRHNLPSSLAVLSQIDKRDWHFPELRFDCVVDMIATYDVAKVHGLVGQLLAEFEAAGIDSLHVRDVLFDSALADDEVDDDEQKDRALLRRTGSQGTAERMRDLGIRLVYRLTDAGPSGGEAIMSEAGQTGSTAPSVVVQMVERYASRPDNLKKLEAASDRSERHLFVWIETSQQAAVAAINFSSGLADEIGMPDRAPELPQCIDAAWAVTAYDKAHIWQFHRELGWRDLGWWQRPDEESSATPPP